MECLSTLAGLVVDFGKLSAELFIALQKYSATVIVGLLFMIFIVYPFILSVFTKVKYLDFFKGISQQMCHVLYKF